MKILIVEDEKLILRCLKLAFEKAGHEVDSSESGQEACSLIAKENYDRILCDLMLQDISGFDIIESAKKKHSPQEIQEKFVIMTAYSSKPILERAQSYGCPVLNKPFSDINELIKTVETHAPHMEVKL